MRDYYMQQKHEREQMAKRLLQEKRRVLRSLRARVPRRVQQNKDLRVAPFPRNDFRAHLDLGQRGVWV